MATPVTNLTNPKLTHYTVTHRMVLLATQAPNSRLFEIANLTADRILELKRLRIEVVQTAAHTAAILDTIEAFRCTGFTVVDTVATVTPVETAMVTGGIASSAVVRGATVAGVAAGMTGGTLTKVASPFLSRGLWLLAAVPTTPGTNLLVVEFNAMRDGDAPMVFKNGEGFIIENGVLLGAAAGSAVSIEATYGVGAGS